MANANVCRPNEWPVDTRTVETGHADGGQQTAEIGHCTQQMVNQYRNIAQRPLAFAFANALYTPLSTHSENAFINDFPPHHPEFLLISSAHKWGLANLK